jgi:ribosomal protein L11 methyltransferase
VDYWKYLFESSRETAEFLPAFLSELPFDTFEESEAGLNAYMPAKADIAAAEAQLADLQAQFEFVWTKEFIPGQNWNQIWEQNFTPVRVHDFCAVRADFHPPIPDVKIELIINPKMAFGTGHHETTWQCIAAMENLPIQNAQLLDFGCGTGILAILASKLGAARIEAVDIEEESYLNTIENSRINGVENIIARCGDLNAVEGKYFDGILANINRHVILPAFPLLAKLCSSGSWLLVSGILEQDEADIKAAAMAVGFNPRKQTQRGNWLCILFEA